MFLFQFTILHCAGGFKFNGWHNTQGQRLQMDDVTAPQKWSRHLYCPLVAGYSHGEELFHVSWWVTDQTERKTSEMVIWCYKTGWNILINNDTGSGLVEHVFRLDLDTAAPHDDQCYMDSGSTWCQKHKMVHIWDQFCTLGDGRDAVVHLCFKSMLHPG